MGGRRDDMVFRPVLTINDPQSIRQQTIRERRRIAGAWKKGGVFHRIARWRLARRVLRKRRMAFRNAVDPKTGQRFQIARRIAGYSPVAVGVAAIVAISIGLGRLLTGRSFENMGQQINNVLLGDYDDNARADMAARRHIESNPSLLRIIAHDGKPNAQIEKLFNSAKKLALADEKGRSHFASDKEMQDNGVFDMLVLRARDAFVRGYTNSGGPHAVLEVRDKLKKIRDGRPR